MSFNKADYSASELESFVQQWVGATTPVELEHVDFTFLPDPKSDNWVEAAVLAGQRGFAALHTQAIFGKAVPLTFSIGSGDLLCDQYPRNGRVRVLCIHDEPLAWTDGGAPSMEPTSAERFVNEWRQRPEPAAIIQRLEASPELNVEALDGELRRSADELLAAYRRLSGPEGGYLPDIIGARPLNDALQCLLPEAERTKRQGVTSVLNDAAWVVASLTRGVAFPPPEVANELRAAIEKWVADPTKSGPATALKFLWAAFFLETKRSEALEIARASSWRVMVDSARLIERLVVDPTLGNRTIVTASGLAKLEHEKASARAEAARLEQAAREQKKARLDAGVVQLGEPESLPQETYGLKLHRVGELPAAMHSLFGFASTTFNQLMAIGPHTWVGTTSTGRWLGVQRGPEPQFPFSYTLLTGKDALAPVGALTGDNQFFHPGGWRGDGDFAYCLAHKVLRELNLEARTHRTLMAWAPEENAIIKAEPLAYAVYPQGLCSIDRDEQGPHLRFCAYVAGGALTTLETFALPCTSVAYDAPSGTLIIVTVAHGIWFSRLREGAWHVVQRLAHVPRVAPFTPDRLTTTVNGLYLASERAFKLLNLERERPEAGVPLIALCGDLSRLAELPTV